MNTANHRTQQALLERILQLRERTTRDQTGLHYIEGIRAVLSALDAGLHVDTLVLSEVLLQNPYAQKRVRLAKRAGTRVVRVTPEEFRSVSGTARASGLGAIVHQHWTALENADPRRGLCWIAVGALRSPGNLGTVLRTAEAAGAAGTIMLAHPVDPFDPDVVRASMGGIFNLQLVRTSPARLARWAREHGCVVVGTAPAGEVLYSDAPVDAPLVLVLGEERRGLTDAEQRLCTHTARIPMAGRADSLNVGVAAGVVLFDVLRRRGDSSAAGAS
ncbi:MAG: RNA methyltransferase [Myxococcota bacterium]